MEQISRPSAYGAAHQTPNMIVVHAMAEQVADDSGDFIHAADFLDRQGLSAHALVAPDGTVIRCRDDAQGAYHARGFNAASLGIEVLVKGRHDYGSFAAAIAKPYLTPEQYEAVVAQCREWVRAYGITRVVRHSELSPGRKVDPGAGFPWFNLLIDIGVRK